MPFVCSPNLCPSNQGNLISLPGRPLPKPYFNDKPKYAGYVSEWDPVSKTHTSRLWMTDLNQDGLPDVIAGQELWTHETPGLQKFVLQLNVNRGDMVFEDQTDALAPEFSEDAATDYSLNLRDIDGSGIDTIFHSAGPPFQSTTDDTRQGNYILVNDGAGHLYAAMHNEFRGMAGQIAALVRARLGTTGALQVASNGTMTPQFIAYRTAAGTLNFVAVVRIFVPTARGTQFALVNVPLGINLTTDFQRDLTVATRNGSRRIRTFAGNDTISRALADPDCAIDGGLGTNQVVYPGNRSQWSITRRGAQVTIKPVAGPGGTDTLTRIQTAVFADQTVNLALVADPNDPPRLANLSTRGLVPPGNALTPGFVIRGAGNKQLLIRGNGPVLAEFGLSGVLADPKLDLIPAGAANPQVSNDNWGTPAGAGAASAAQLATVFGQAGAFALPAGSRDAAVLASVASGGYSARVSATTPTDTGLALAEIYDLDANTAPSQLVNVSVLGFAGTGAQALTPGFVIRGSSSKQLLIRAMGPGLAQFGVGDLLADPQLAVIPAGQSAPIASNNDWAGTPALKAAFASAAAFPLAADTSKDAAVLVTLAPGGYSVVVSGVGDTTGNALVEIYDLGP